jgi:ADP-heptose:LPS heptosyltransferase/predicted SAM-dependent methyltransferase
MVWKIDNPQCNESKKIVWEVAPYLRGRGLDLGAGDFKVLPHVISVDNMNHEQFGFTVKPDVLADVTKLDMFASQSMDFVYSSHTLEHVMDYAGALKEWWRVVKQGGYLILYLPHKDFYPNIGQPGANPDHKHDFLPADIIAAMPQGWDLVQCQERNEDMEYSMLLIFKKINRKYNMESWRDPRPEKTACVVRYGAFGDLMQASSVFAGLKQQGYYVTLFTSLPGADVITYDPHIDELVLFDKDQVPNGNLMDFWAWQKKKYDHWVNLSESVEGTLLAMPGRTAHTWSPQVRHSMLNKNYLQFQHELAGVPHLPQVKFYATAEEQVWAARQREKLGDGPVVVWSLAGSSVHKTWAGLDAIIAQTLVNIPQTTFVLVGGPECGILEQGWENEKRVVRTCGVWSIRQTLAFLPHADLIIGPETGVLNAACCLEVPKVLFLSHSTQENLCRDWVNTHAFYGKTTCCAARGPATLGVTACHMLHYGWAHCEIDTVQGVAKCQADISPEEVWDVVGRILLTSYTLKYKD